MANNDVSVEDEELRELLRQVHNHGKNDGLVSIDYEPEMGMFEALARLKIIIKRREHEAELRGQKNELKKLLKEHSEQHIAKHSIHGVYDDIPKGSTLAMIPIIHINDRLAEFTAPTKGKDNE